MPTGSPLPDVEIPQTDIWTFLFENKNKGYSDDKVIFTDPFTSRSYTWKQTRDASIDFAKGLRGLWDFQKNETVCLFSPNSIDTPIIIWGTHWAGGVVSLANPAYTASELAFQLKDSGASVLITQVPFLPIAREAAKIAGINPERIALIGDQKDPEGRVKHFTNVRNISGTSRFRRVKKTPDDLAFVAYSSGTTGLPKGVMLSHGNIVANLVMGRAVDSQLSSTGGEDNKGDKVVAFLPFYHIYGLTCLIHAAMQVGLELVVMPKFDIEDFCRIVQDYKITFAYVVPPIVLLLAKHPIVSKYNLSSLRMMNSGAAPLTKELTMAMYNRIKVPVKQGYGLSETSPTTHTQLWENWNKPIGSVGVLLPNQIAKYMSPEEKEVPTGEVGELWLKGPNVFKGYLNNKEMTEKALTEDGFFRTGDVGYQDKEGNFFITDRVKELIKYKGFQVAPAELEGLLASHDKIADVAVVGLYKKAEATEVPRAYVVVSQGVNKDQKIADEISSWLAGKVAGHKKLRGGVSFVDEIPKSAAGKILRRVLKLKAQEEEDGPKAKL